MEYDTVVKKEFIKPSRQEFPDNIKPQADAIVKEFVDDYSDDVAISRDGKLYTFRGDVWYSQINSHVNYVMKKSKYNSAVYDYVYDELVKLGFYIHS